MSQGKTGTSKDPAASPRRRGPVIAILLLWMLLAAVLLLSPYRHSSGFPVKLLACSVEIAAPPDSVFRFLGNSGNARRWSVFVDHIAPLNADSVPDGSPGSRRRCFCKRDETGRRWDESILEVDPGKRRRLSIYNLVGFAAASDHLATDQIYASLPGGKCKLTFTVFFNQAQSTWREDFEMYFAAYPIKNIFARNLANIKRLVESGN